MAKRTKKPEPAKQPWEIWHQYPEPDDRRSGMKVSWNYYKDREAAEACAAAAKHNAQIQLARGYDFGYCGPGSIVQIDEKYGMPEKLGMFEVCLP